MKLVLTILLLTSLFGCAVAQKDYAYMASEEYQSKPKLTQALISASEPLSETSIQKILASKVSLPKNES